MNRFLSALALSLVLSPALTAIPVEAGCCNSGSGSYRLPSFSSSKSYNTYWVEVTNKTNTIIYVQGKFGEVEVPRGRSRGLWVQSTRKGEINRLSFDSKYSSYNDRFITYMPSPGPNKEIEFRYKNGELRYYWVTRLGR